MAFENLGKCIPLPAAADLSASQYCFVYINSSGQAALAGDGDDANGVLQDDPAAAGRPANVMVGIGTTVVKTGAAVLAGSLAASDSTGRAVNPATGDYILGVFQETSTGANQYVAMLFQRQAKTA